MISASLSLDTKLVSLALEEVVWLIELSDPK